MPEPASQARHRPSRGWWFVVPVALLAWLMSTPFGGWLQSAVTGSGVRWQDAYTALDTAEANLPRGAREREHLLLALTQAEGGAPKGLAFGPRLYPAGTFARLRYETFDEDGERLDQWRVRALVPAIGNGNGPFWREQCTRECGQEIDRSGGFRLRRSGLPGIAEEWVLRMPVGRTFDLPVAPLNFQDILDDRERSLGIGTVRVGDRFLRRPARSTVTLEEACPAKGRVGTVMSLEFFPNASLPIPRGFATSRWAQMDGCGRPAQLPVEPAKARIAVSDDARKPEALAISPSAAR